MGVNPNTIKKAYDILEARGIIISKSTKGTFISEELKDLKEFKIDSLIKDLEDIIKELESYGLTKEDILKKIK